MKPGKGSQSGMALLTVLLVLAMITTLAASMTGRSQMSVRRTINLSDYDQAYWYALSSEALAKRVLKKDFEDTPDRTHLQQIWASSEVLYPVGRGQIAGKIDDLRACFNLNALSQGLNDTEKSKDAYQMPVAGRQFRSMLEALEIDGSYAEVLAERIRDYTDADDDMSGSNGAENADYSARPVPYKVPNNVMLHHSELRAVMGSNQMIYKALMDYICVIPSNVEQKLNINTLPVERSALLVGMLEGKMSLDEATTVLESRPYEGWETVQAFLDEPAISGLGLTGDVSSYFTVSSTHFRLHGTAKVENAVFRLESILWRNAEKKFSVLTRQYGGQQ